MIEFTNVSYAYGVLGRKQTNALSGVSFTASPGEILGLAGANGAGKTTLLSLLLGFIKPSEGQIRIDGKEPRAFVEQEGAGYVPELVAMAPQWTVRTALARLAILERSMSEVVPVLERFDLDRFASAKLKTLSKGSLQRVGIAQALLSEHRLYVFDEPTHGLDPEWTQRFRALVRSLSTPDRLIVISSHNLDELERLCDRVIIMDRGTLKRTVTVGAVEAASYTVFGATLKHVRLEAIQHLCPGARALGDDRYELPVRDQPHLNAVLKSLLSQEVDIVQLAPQMASLERHFAQVLEQRR